LLVGKAYDLAPTAHSWSISITAETTKGPHAFFDAVHPWMTGVLDVH
jgi:hypothetical protein